MDLLLVFGVDVCAVLHEHAADISVFFQSGNDEGSVVAETEENEITTSIPNIAEQTLSGMQQWDSRIVLGVDICTVLHKHAADISKTFPCGKDEGRVTPEKEENEITTSVPNIADLTVSVMQKGLTPCSWR